jgi:hypothetical protein
MSEVVRIRPGLLEWRMVDGEIVALDLRTKRYLAINDTGAAVWTGLVQGTTRQALVATLTEKFEVSDETAADDIEIFLQELAAQDLLDST